MSEDTHFWRLFAAFGQVLVRHRRKRNWTAYRLGLDADLSGGEIIGRESGEHAPTLRDFFRIANALGAEPALLFIDLLSAWRADPTDTNRTFRPHDITRPSRLAYHHKPGDFRELLTTYDSVAEATRAAGKLNAQRHARGVALLDTVAIYLRLDCISLRPDDGETRGRAVKRLHRDAQS